MLTFILNIKKLAICLYVPTLNNEFKRNVLLLAGYLKNLTSCMPSVLKYKYEHIFISCVKEKYNKQFNDNRFKYSMLQIRVEPAYWHGYINK